MYACICRHTHALADEDAHAASASRGLEQHRVPHRRCRSHGLLSALQQPAATQHWHLRGVGGAGAERKGRQQAGYCGMERSLTPASLASSRATCLRYWCAWHGGPVQQHQNTDSSLPCWPACLSESKVVTDVRHLQCTYSRMYCAMQHQHKDNTRDDPPPPRWPARVRRA